MALNTAQQSALFEILNRLQGQDLVWALTGSTSFVLQGVPIPPHDIDIQADQTGAYGINRLLADSMVKSVSFSATSWIQSHYGVAELHGIAIDIMGAVQKRLPDDHWESPVDVAAHRRWIQWQGHRVPVLDLAYESRAYRLMGRIERADLLAAFVAAQKKAHS